jgi:hypothetical protein
MISADIILSDGQQILFPLEYATLSDNCDGPLRYIPKGYAEHTGSALYMSYDLSRPRFKASGAESFLIDRVIESGKEFHLKSYVEYNQTHFTVNYWINGGSPRLSVIMQGTDVGLLDEFMHRTLQGDWPCGSSHGFFPGH